MPYLRLEEEEEVEEDISGFTSNMQLATDLFQEQRTKGTRKFIRGKDSSKSTHNASNLGCLYYS